MEISKIKGGRGFAYSSAPQGSPEWIKLRAGKVTASDLKRWLSVAKKPNKEGVHPPLKARLDYERELAYERQFDVPFTRFTTEAMEEGKQAEDLVARQYSAQTGNPVEKCGAFYNDCFVASPDRLSGDDGLVEIKWLYDTSFIEVLSDGPIIDHYLQMQGQLWASGRKWCDYVVGNGNSGKFKVIRVKRDPETIKRIKESLVDLDDIVGDYDSEGLYDLNASPKFEVTGNKEDPWS